MKLNTKEEVYLLMYSTIPTAALHAAIETGLLWKLAERPLSAADIVQALSIPGKRGYYWLQLLEDIGVLEVGPKGYSPSPLARQAILETRSQESWQHLALDERERTAGVSDLPVYIREPGSFWTARGVRTLWDYVEKMRDSPARAGEFTRMLFEVHQPLAKLITEVLDMTGVHRLMDLGGGSGVVSMALLRKYPALTATVVDIENVCIAGREIAVEEGLSERISYHPAEFDRDEFPAGFDMVLQCDVGLFELALFQKVYASLKPGGRLVFVELISPSERSAPPNRVAWTFVDSLYDPDFSFPTLDQAETLLAQAGFEVLPGHQTIGSGLIFLQARK